MIPSIILIAFCIAFWRVYKAFINHQNSEQKSNTTEEFPKESAEPEHIKQIKAMLKNGLFDNNINAFRNIYGSLPNQKLIGWLALANLPKKEIQFDKWGMEHTLMQFEPFDFSAQEQQLDSNFHQFFNSALNSEEIWYSLMGLAVPFGNDGIGNDYSLTLFPRIDLHSHDHEFLIKGFKEISNYSGYDMIIEQAYDTKTNNIIQEIEKACLPVSYVNSTLNYEDVRFLHRLVSSDFRDKIPSNLLTNEQLIKYLKPNTDISLFPVMVYHLVLYFLSAQDQNLKELTALLKAKQLDKALIVNQIIRLIDQYENHQLPSDLNLKINSIRLKLADLIYDRQNIEQNIWKDPKDGQTYKTIRINNLTWLVENYNYEAPNSHLNSSETSQSKLHGRLYAWQDAIELAPDGWRLPNDEDWKELELFYGVPISEIENDGESQRRGSPLIIEELLAGGSMPTQFTKPGFAYLKEGTVTFTNFEQDGFYWSSTSTNESNSIIRSFLDKSLFRYEYPTNTYLSVRYVKDLKEN